MLIRLIISPADQNRSGANQVRQHLSVREHFRRGNAPEQTANRPHPIIQCVREHHPGKGRPCGPPLTRLKALIGVPLSKDRIHRMIPQPRPSCSSRNRRSLLRCIAPGMEPQWGAPVPNYVAGLPPDARRFRQGPAPRRRHRRRYPTRG